MDGRVWIGECGCEVQGSVDVRVHGSMDENRERAGKSEGQTSSSFSSKILRRLSGMISFRPTEGALVSVCRDQTAPGLLPLRNDSTSSLMFLDNLY